MVSTHMSTAQCTQCHASHLTPYRLTLHPSPQPRQVLEEAVMPGEGEVEERAMHQTLFTHCPISTPLLHVAGAGGGCDAW
jgi:hypothetical protein